MFGNDNDPRLSLDWNRLMHEPMKRRRSTMRMLALRKVWSDPPSVEGAALPVAGRADFVAVLQEGGAFRPDRLVASVHGGPIVDWSRFYGLRVRRTSSKRKARRSALLAASEAMKVGRDPRAVRPWIEITNIRIGNVSQTARDARIPIELFAPDSLLGPLHFDSMVTAQEFRVSIENLDGRVAHVALAIAGQHESE